MVYVCGQTVEGAKMAKLEYNVVQEKNGLSLTEITLHTGRSHQIRVQFSSRKMPLLGDGKYGSKSNKCSVALWSHSLLIPQNGSELEVKSFPQKDAYPWCLFDTESIS